MRSGPLAGVKVLSLENYLAGNHVTFLLGLLGAEVIKIEHGEGDAMRSVGPFLQGDGGRRRSAGELRLMTNKRSIRLNLGTGEAKEMLFRLVEKVDVFFTNQKPSTLKAMGIDFDVLKTRNARIIYATLSGFGHDDVMSAGPFGDWVAFDVIAQGLSGLQFRVSGEGDKPGYNGLPLGDENTSLLTVLGTLGALYRREKSNEAQRVDVAMHDAMVFCNELALGACSLFDVVPARGRSATSAPYGAFRTRDGWINIGVGGDPVWERFCEAIERNDLVDDPRFKAAAARVKSGSALDDIVEAWTSQRTTEEAVRILHRHTVPAAPIFTIPEALRSPQVAAREMLMTIDDPIVGRRRVVGNPIKMKGLDNTSPAPPPELGADTSAVLRELLGMTDEEEKPLRERGVLS